MLGLENRYRLSFYEKLGNLSNHSHISLVRHVDTGKIYVKKELTNYNISVYQFLQSHPMEFYPNITELIEDDGTLYLIEEYITGTTLQQYLEKQGRMALPQAKNILLQVCVALQFLHAQNPPIIHRDLKPTNIILNENNQVTLIDFNVSRLFEPDQSQDTVIGGTRGFAAPEQYGKHQSDVRTDIYALGVLLHYMLTLDYPANCSYQGEAQNMIEKCTDYYPEKRYQNVGQLIRDVEKLPELYPEENRDVGIVKPKSKRFPFLPPGFRTPRLWKCIVATLGYFTILFAGLTLQVEGDNGAAVSSMEIFCNRLVFLAMFLGLIFFWFNYMNIQKRLPLCKNKYRGIRIIGVALYSVAYVFLLFFLLSFV